MKGMRNTWLSILFTAMGWVSLPAEIAGKAVEDDLDAIVTPKAGAAKQAKDAATADGVFDAISLKENPTRSDVTDYLKKLKTAWAKETEKINQRMRSGAGSIRLDDQLAGKFNTVPSVFLQEMLASVSQDSGFENSHYRNQMIASVNSRSDLDDSSRSLILKYLPDYPDLIETLVKFGWEKNAETLVVKSAYRAKRGMLYRETLIKVLAEYRTPAAKKVLVDLLKTSSGSGVFLENNLGALALVADHGVDVDDVVATVWKKSQVEGVIQAGYAAPVAAKFGHLDALLYVAKRLNAAPDSRNSSDKRVRERCLDALQQVVPQGGTDEKSLVNYVLTNRTKLVFDKELKEYHLPR